MDFKEYQEKAKETALYPKANPSWVYPALGLAGESGEIMNKLKKIIRDSNFEVSEEKLEELEGEFGDILWYVAMLCTEFGLNLDEVAQNNIQKLSSRKERGTLHGDGDKR